ncbi:MAG: hypothetical protein U1E23_07025 [Reyranellaceae bacterium]
MPFASTLAGVFWDRDGDFEYVALCRATTLGGRSQEALTGDVFIVQRKTAWANAKQAVETLRTVLDGYSERAGHGSLADYVNREWNNCLQALEKLCAFTVKLEICRSGRTTIEVDDADLTREDRPSLGKTRVTQERVAQWLSAQIFYFLRDIGHHHQHHDPTTDTIVDLVRFDGIDDLSWRQQVLYNIYRTIIQYKRNPQNKEFHACLGLLAYASTFREVSKQELDSASAEQLPYFHDSGLERSLRSLQDVNQLESERRSQRNSVLQNIVLWIVGTVISVVGLLQVTDDKFKINDPSDILLWFARFAVQKTDVLVGIVLCLVILTVISHSDAGWNPRRWKFTVGIVRLVSAWPQYLSGSVNIAIGVLIFLAVAYFSGVI